MVGTGAGAVGPDRSTDERWVVTAAEQQRLDEASYTLGLPQDSLMESAGHGAADWVLQHFRPLRAAVLVGPGGNGGDALVLARLTLDVGVEVEAFLLTAEDRLSPACRRMLDRFQAGGGSVRPLASETLEPILESGALVIDGLFGSGLHRPLGGPTAAMIERLNVAPVRVVSLDLPSGLYADDRLVEGAAVRADVTLAMGFLKPAHLFYPAASACGNVAVIPVDYPSEVLQDGRPVARVLEERGVFRRLPQRMADGHKGTFGSVLVVGGSIGMTGAAIFAARGALRAGAGLVKLAAPASLNPVLEASLPEVITVPLPDVNGHLTAASWEEMAEPLRHSDVLAIGPGLSRSDDVVEAICRILETFQGPAVIDADALFALSRRRGVLATLRGRALLTPHPGEFSSLADIEISSVESDRVVAARRFAEQNGVSLLLKGRPTVIALSDGGIYLNPTGNTGLATGGSGDVLTGVIAGLIAGGATLGDAALVGAYVHGLTAEIYAADRSERSQIPSDVVDLLPKAFREIEQCD